MKGTLVKAYMEREGRHSVLKFALKLLGMDTEFREEDHPRDESGRFTSGGGSAGSAKPASETKPKEITNDPEEIVEDPDFDIFSFEEEEETPEEIAAKKEKERKAEREEKERGRYGNNGLREEDYPEDLRFTSEEQKIVADIFREYKDPEFKSSGSADVIDALNGLTTQEYLEAREKKLKEAIQQSTEEINKKKESGYTYKTHNPQSNMTGRQKLAQWWNDIFEHGAPINNWGENGIQYWQRLRAESQRQSKQIDLAKKIVKRNEFAQKQPGYMPWKKNPNSVNKHYRPWLENDSIGKDAEFREEDHPRDENGKFTSGNGSRAPKSSSEIREMVVGQYNWLDNVVTKSEFDFLHEARKKKEDLEKQYLEKQKAAEEELVNVDPQLGRLFSGMFEENYSEKGRQLLKEAKELKPQIDEAEMDEKYWQKKLKDKKKANHDKQVASFRPEPLKKATKEDYDGFKLEGDTSGLRDALESGKAQVYEMSPKEYLERCAYEIFDGSTIENTIAGTEADNVNKYADLMANGDKFPIPYLDYDTQNQEGRHRALAAMINGIKTIPVAIIGKPPKRGANDAEFKEEDHPRDEDGKFAPKGGGSSSSGSASKHSEAVIKAASEAKNYADFWYNLPEDEQRKYKTSEEIKKAYEEAKAVAPEAPEWKPTVGTKADMPKSVKLPEKLPEIKIVNNPDDTATAHAGKPGEIEINLANFDPENIDSIIAHEAAHQMSNADPELQAAIMQNFGDVLGRYNQKKQHFDGIYGEYNPEEAFATGFSNYLNHPEHMKEHYPDAYEFFDDLAKNQPETVDFLKNTIQKAKNAVSGNEKPERSDSKYYKDLEKRRNIALSWQPDRQAEYLFRQGFLTEEDAVEAMENGTASDRMQDYFAVMEYNGDPTPTKPVREAPDMYTEVKNGKGGGDWVQARKDYIKEWTGQSDEEVEETYDQLHTWFSNQWGRANTETIDRYIDQDGACGREIYRGMHFTEDEYAEFMKNVAPGAKIGMNGRNSSWTTNREDAWNFSRNGDRQVIITCKKNKTSAPVEHLSDKGESEVLAHSRAQWTVIGIQEGSNRTEITVYEAEERMSPEERDRRKAQNDAEPEEEREASLEERMNGQNGFITVTPPPADLFKREANDGGPGSGNWGHKGRPGHVGGSGKGGGSQYRGGNGNVGYFGSRKDWMNGLSGDDQHKAARFIANRKRDLNQRLEVKKKIQNIAARGMLTYQEAEERIKKDHLDQLSEATTVEEYVMKAGSKDEKEELLNHVQGGRRWKDNANKLIQENWDENDKKLASALADKYGRAFVGGAEIPDDSSMTDKWEPDDLECWYDLKAKALELPTSGKEAPDELQYEAGIKERPAPPAPEGPDVSWFDDPNRGGSNGGNDVQNLMRITKRAIGEPFNYGVDYKKEDFIDANQKLVDLMQYGNIEPKLLSSYAVRSIYELRQSMSEKKFDSSILGFRKSFSYTPEMIERLSDDEKSRLLNIVNSYYNQGRFVYKNFDKIEDLDQDVLAHAEMAMWHTTPRSNIAKQQLKDYVLLQEKMMLGVEPRSPEDVNAAKEAEKTEKERVHAEKVKKWKSTHTEEDIKKMYHPATVSGVSRGNPMNSMDADLQSANPDRSKHVGKERGNCQTCVMAYELRRRGYNVVAKPRYGDAEAEQKKLSNPDESGWLDPETGEDVQRIVPDKKLNRVNAAKWLDNTIKEGERYEISVCWSTCRGAHVLIAEKENGKLTLVDPQNGKRRTDHEIVDFFGGVHLNSTANGNWRPYLRRVDNALPKQEFYDKILLKA